MGQRLGIAPSEFWRLCPFELRHRAEGWLAQQRLEDDRILAQAWHTARLHRIAAKDFPTLPGLLARAEGREEIQVAAIDAVTRAGIPIIKKPRGGTDATAGTPGTD